MAEGSPDYTNPVEIKGLFDTALKTIAVDKDGQLYALLKGKHGEVYIPLELDTNGFITAILKGSDGTTLRSVLTDTAGRVINVLRDPTTNNYVKVDTDGFLTTVLKGSDGDGLQTLLTDSGGRAIMVLRDKTGEHYAAINENGQLQAVMLGQHNTTPTIMAVDTDGNMIAKIVDPTNVFGTTPYIGNAELAARLGSPNIWHRTGATVLMDSFQYGLTGWTTATTGAGGGIALVSDYFSSKGYCVKIATGTGDTPNTYIQRTARYGSYSGKVGLEFHVSNFHLYGTLEVQFRLDNGVDIYYFDFKYDWNTMFIYYRDSDGEWHTTGKSVAFAVIPTDWHSIKIIGDTSTGKYIAFLIDDNFISLADLVCYTFGYSSKSQTTIKITLTGKTGEDSIVSYVDDIIYTIAEP